MRSSVFRIATTIALTVGALAQAGLAAAEEGDKVDVAVMDLQVSAGIPKELVGTLTSATSEELDRAGAFRAISSQDIKRMLDFESQRILVGCTDDAGCLAEVGAALGADYLVAGSVILLDQAYAKLKGFILTK